MNRTASDANLMARATSGETRATAPPIPGEQAAPGAKCRRREHGAPGAVGGLGYGRAEERLAGRHNYSGRPFHEITGCGRGSVDGGCHRHDSGVTEHAVARIGSLGAGVHWAAYSRAQAVVCRRCVSDGTGDARGWPRVEERLGDGLERVAAQAPHGQDCGKQAERAARSVHGVSQSMLLDVNPRSCRSHPHCPSKQEVSEARRRRRRTV
jgi:hypothetical protein